MSCLYKYKGKDYTKDEFYSLVRTTMVQPRTVQKYEKVLFPNGNTISKIEHFDQILEKIKEFDNKIEILKNSTIDDYVKTDELDNGVLVYKRKDNQSLGYSTLQISKDFTFEDNIQESINKLEKDKSHYENTEQQRLGTINFYENTITNILNKIYGKENVKQITDEYGNTWNEVIIVPERDLSQIQFQQSNQLIPTQQSETYDYIFQKLFDNFKPYISELITDRERADEILKQYNGATEQSVSYKELNDYYNNFINDLKQYEDIILNQIYNMFDIPNEEELYNEMLNKYRNKFLYFGIPNVLSAILMKRNKLNSIKIDIPYFIEHILLNKSHNITLDTIYDLVESLHKPIAVFKNIPYANRYKIITDKIININGKPKVLCIVLNTEFENKEEIYPGIVTAYFMDYELNTLIYHNALISADKEKLIKLVDTINNNQDEITVTTELRDIDMVLDNEIRQTAPKSTVSISNIIGKIIDYKVINYKQENIQFQDLSEYNNENEQKEFTKEPYFNNNTENFDTNSAVENQVIEFSNNESSYTWNINTNPDNIIKRLQLKYPDLDFVIIKEQQDNNELLKAKVKPNKLKRFNLNNPIIESLDLDIFTIDDELKNKRNNIELFFNGDVGIVMNNTIYFIYRDLFSTSPLKVILNEELKDFTVMSVDQVNQKITSDNVVYMTKDEYDNIKKELYKTSRKIQDLMQQQALSKIELLKKIKDTTPYRYYELLSDQLINNLPLLKNKKIRLSSISNISYYNPKTDKVYYNLDYINNAMVLLHELMHNFKNKALSQKLSEVDEEFFAKLKTLYEKALGHSINNNAELFIGYEQKMGIDGNIYYGLTNLNEFLAESMVNPEFQEYLASIKTEGNNSVLSEIYQALVKFIKELLNTDITNESNLLKDTIDTIVDFMENHNIYENMGEDLQWDKWKVQIITVDPSITFEIWQGLTNKEKIKIINCI